MSNEKIKTITPKRVRDAVDGLTFIHCVFQELQDNNIALPMGDYNLMYDILESVRDDLEIGSL